MTYLFLDTNIFLHFKAFNDVPWDIISGSNDYTIVFAPIVISELDKHKNAQNNKIASKAKATIEKLRKINNKTVSLNFPVLILSQRPSEDTISKNNLSSTHQDDSLIASVIEFKVEDTDKKIIITSDFSLELRMSSYDLKCVVMPEEYRLSAELDETEKKLKEAERELNELKNRQPKPSISFNNGSNQLKHIPKKMQFDKEEYVKRELSKVMRNNSHMKKDTDDDPYKNLLTALNAFNRISDSQINDYNSELDKFYVESERYLHKEYNYKLYLSTCVEIELFMSNSGTLPADDIDIHLHFPDGFELVKNLKDEPKKPEPPYRPRSLFDMQPLSSLEVLMPQRTSPKPEDPTLPKLTQLQKTNSYDVGFKLKTLKHGGKDISLGKLYACFDNMEAMKNFHIAYTLVIANLPKSIEGQLHVIITDLKDV